MVFLGILLTFRTDKGTLVLEVGPADVRVEIDGTEVHLKSPRDDIKLAVGDHELIVKKDGFETRTRSFHVRRNDKTEMLVRLEPVEKPHSEPIEKPLFEDRFQGNNISRELWNIRQTNRYSYMGSGRTTHQIEQKNDSLLLSAEAAHDGGWTCVELYLAGFGTGSPQQGGLNGGNRMVG